MFDALCRPRVAAPWRLRNDQDYMLAYPCTGDDLKWVILAPVEATLVTFLDGTQTYRELQELWLYLYDAGDEDRKRCLAILDDALRSLIDNGVVSLIGELSPSFGTTSEPSLPDLSRDCRNRYRLKKPLKVTVSPTNRCAAACVYCYAERRSVKEMSLSEWIRLFDDLHEHQIYLVDVGGGDLFARADALDILREMVAREFVFFLSSKCDFSAAVADRLAALGIGVPNGPAHLIRPLQISVDSAANDVASFLAGRKDYLHKADATVRHLVGAGIAPRIKCVLTPYNAGAAAGLVEHFVSLGIRRFQFVQYGRSHYRHRDDLFLTKQQKVALHETMPSLTESHPEVEIVWQQDVSVGDEPPRRSEELWRERSICSGGRVSMQIEANGDAIPCEQIPHRPEYVLGNVVQQGLLAVWEGRRLQELIFPPRDTFEGTACSTCPTYVDCHEGRGYCYRESLFHYGTLFDAPPDCPRQTKAPVRQI